MFGNSDWRERLREDLDPETRKSQDPTPEGNNTIIYLLLVGTVVLSLIIIAAFVALVWL